MRDILLPGIFLGLKDLLTKRLPALKSFAAGAASVGPLTAQRDAMAGLPTITGTNPALETLERVDQEHDGFGRAIWHMLEAYRVFPRTPDDMRKAAEMLQAVLVPSLQDLTLSYEAEVAARIARQDLDLEKELTMFPVPASFTTYGDTPTLSDWRAMFDTSAVEVQLASRDQTKEDTRNRNETNRLRTETIGMLNQLRTSLTLAAQQDAKLPADLEAQVFGYFDQLEKQATEAKPPAPATPAAT